MGPTGDVHGRAHEPHSIFIDELSPVGHSLVWAFSHGITWSPRLYDAFANHRSLEAFTGDSAAWRSGDSDDDGTRKTFLLETGTEAASDVGSKTQIKGEELYQILSHRIFEREGVEHQNKRIPNNQDGAPVKDWIDGTVEGKEIAFDRRGIAAKTCASRIQIGTALFSMLSVSNSRFR